MHHVCGILSLGFLFAVMPLTARADDQLDVRFDTPIAEIAPRSTAHAVQLPSLTFTITARGQCPDTQRVESISISIADTRITVSPTNQDVIEESIRVSGKQLGPVAVEDYCLAETATADMGALQIDDALTANLSLRCSDDKGESIRYKAVALSIALQCEIAEPTE